MPSLNVDELQENCKFTEDGYKKDDLTVKYFFEVIREWDDTMKANFLFFFTGKLLILINKKDRSRYRWMGSRTTH
jgi:hypothetical protein